MRLCFSVCFSPPQIFAYAALNASPCQRHRGSFYYYYYYLYIYIFLFIISQTPPLRFTYNWHGDQRGLVTGDPEEHWPCVEIRSLCARFNGLCLGVDIGITHLCDFHVLLHFVIWLGAVRKHHIIIFLRLFFLLFLPTTASWVKQSEAKALTKHFSFWSLQHFKRHVCVNAMS